MKNPNRTRIIRHFKPLEKSMPPTHVLLVKCQTRMGWHKPGELGKFLNTADGFGSFFPERGGWVRLSTKQVARSKPEKARVVKRQPKGLRIVKHEPIKRRKIKRL